MPIYFAWFTTALLSVGSDANDQNLPQSGRLLYCVIRGFIDIYPPVTPKWAGAYGSRPGYSTHKFHFVLAYTRLSVYRPRSWASLETCNSWLKEKDRQCENLCGLCQSESRSSPWLAYSCR